MKNIFKLFLITVTILRTVDLGAETRPTKRIVVSEKTVRWTCKTLVMGMGMASVAFVTQGVLDYRKEQQAKLQADIQSNQIAAASIESLLSKFRSDSSSFYQSVEGRTDLIDPNSWDEALLERWSKYFAVRDKLDDLLSSNKINFDRDSLGSDQLSRAVTEARARTILDMDFDRFNRWHSIASAAEVSLKAKDREAKIRLLVQFKDTFDTGIEELEQAINQLASTQGESEIVKSKRADLEKLKKDRDDIVKDIQDLRGH